MQIEPVGKSKQRLGCKHTFECWNEKEGHMVGGKGRGNKGIEYYDPTLGRRLVINYIQLFLKERR